MVIKYFGSLLATLLLLIGGRDFLEKNNLIDNGYGELEKKNIECTSRDLVARSDDGSCNYLGNKTSEKGYTYAPAMGAAGVPLGRNVKKEAVYKEKASKTLLEPNPIAISRELLSREKKNGEVQVKELPLSLFVTSWIQFQNHDWFAHANNEVDYKKYIQVQIPEKFKPEFRQSGAIQEVKDLFDLDEFMVLPETKVARTATDENGEEYFVYDNRVTHWWDLSQVYGSNLNTVAMVRSGKNGKLKVNEQNIIPLANSTVGVRGDYQKKEGLPETGFFDNWWSGLSVMHDVFTRNHNMIVADRVLKQEVIEQLRNADELFYLDFKNVEMIKVKKDDVFNTDGSVKDTNLYNKVVDQALYDKGRLINSAISAKVHTIEWTPAVLQTTALDIGLRSNWYGILEGQIDKDPNLQTLAKLLRRYQDAPTRDLTKLSKLSGIVGGKRDLSGAPFSITEEFTAVYRLHPLLPEGMDLFKDGKKNTSQKVAIDAMREEKSAYYSDKYSLTDLAYSVGQAPSAQLVLGNYPDFLQNLEVPFLGKLDMAAVDIIRDRERGVPRYNDFRREIGLKELISFADLFAYNSNLKANRLDCIDFRDLDFFSMKEEGIEEDLVFKHCKLEKMQRTVDDYREYFERNQGRLDDNRVKRRLTRLKLDIQKDLKEREAALTPSQKVVVSKLKKLYNTPKLESYFRKDFQDALELEDNIYALDLQVGSLAESFRHSPEKRNGYIGFGFGETAFQIFLLMASRRLLADRFLNMDFRKEVYTQRGIDIVDNATFRGVLVCTLSENQKLIEEALKCTRSPFHAWNKPGEKANCSKKNAPHEKVFKARADWYKNFCKGL